MDFDQVNAGRRRSQQKRNWFFAIIGFVVGAFYFFSGRHISGIGAVAIGASVLVDNVLMARSISDRLRLVVRVVLVSLVIIVAGIVYRFLEPQ